MCNARLQRFSVGALIAPPILVVIKGEKSFGSRLGSRIFFLIQGRRFSRRSLDVPFDRNVG